MKAGWKSTEFWFMVVSSVLKILAQAGVLGANVAPDSFDTLLYGGGLYAVGRGAAKIAGK